MKTFRRLVGIDWSGAKGATQSGIQIAEIEANSIFPRLIRPPNGRKWSRSGVLEYIAGLLDEPTLVGIDFAFSVPWSTDGAVISAWDVSNVRSLWALVESICDGTPNLYAGPVWTAPDSPFRPYIFHHQTKHKGERYYRSNRRQVENLEGNAISVYHMAGPQVGAGSFSGMRMLHQITKSHREAVAIWPFDIVDGTRTAVVEIYPSFFYRKAGARRPTGKDLIESNYAEIDKTLNYYGATRTANFGVCRSVDQADALISAAALRKLANKLAFNFQPSPNFDLREGWIFGLPLGA
jgi:hypothetical protein